MAYHRLWIIRISAGPEGLCLPFQYHYAAEHGELCASRTGRVAVVGSRAMARFPTEQAARDWLTQLRHKRGAVYTVTPYDEQEPTMSKRFEIEPKTVQVRLYEDHPDNYEAQFTGYILGKNLHISGLVSKKDAFYFEFGALLPDILHTLHCVRAELACTGAHARLLRSALSRWVDVDIKGGFRAFDREMVEVTLTPHPAELHQVA